MVFAAYQRDLADALNESPSEKEGKSADHTTCGHARVVPQ